MRRVLIPLLTGMALLVASGVPAGAPSPAVAQEGRVWTLEDTRVVIPDAMPWGEADTEIVVTETSVIVQLTWEDGSNRWEFRWNRPPSHLDIGQTVQFELTEKVIADNGRKAFVPRPAVRITRADVQLGNSVEADLGLLEDENGELNGELELSATGQFTMPESGPIGRGELGIAVKLESVYTSPSSPAVVTWTYRLNEEEPAPSPSPASATATPAASSPTATPTPFVPSGPLNAECAIDQAAFDRDWLRYSDIDDRIPLGERSHEAREWERVASRISELTVKGFELEAEMEIDRLMRLELREYRQALVRNIKTNLLKAFWRLSYVTYSTIKKGFTMGDAYGKALTSASAIKQLGTGLQTVQGLTPPAPSYSAPDLGARIKSQLKNAAMSPGLQILTADSPADFGAAVFNDMQSAAGSAVVPSADISEEEIGILRTQHLEKRVLDDVLQESYRLNSQRRETLQQIEAEVATLREELQDWADQEKDRVARSLRADCEARR